jgi:hypothetical protein
MSSIYPSYGSAPIQLCQRCGRQLPPNEVNCGNCGLINVPLQPNNSFAQPPSTTPWGSTPQPTPSGTSQFGGQPWMQSPAQPASNSSSNGFSVPQQAFGPPNQFQAGTNIPSETFGQQSSPNNFYGPPVQQPQFYAQPSQQPTAGGFHPGNLNNFQQSGFTQVPTTNSYNQPGYAQFPGASSYPSNNFTQQAEEQKRNPKIAMIITIAVILLVVVGGSIGGYLYVKKNAATTTIQVPTTLAPTSVPRGKPLFSDALTNNNSGWDLTSKPGEFSVKIGNGSMVLEDDNNKLFSELIPGGRNFSNFFFTADAILSKGSQNNGYGIYIRGASNQSFDIATYYRFELYGDGTFAIFKGSVDGTGTSTSSFLVNYLQSTAIQKQGKINHIAISTQGPTMTFSVNGQVLQTVTDNTYSSGSIAFFVSNLPHSAPGAQATFSNISVYPPQS